MVFLRCFKCCGRLVLILIRGCAGRGSRLGWYLGRGGAVTTSINEGREGGSFSRDLGDRCVVSTSVDCKGFSGQEAIV